MQVSLIDTGSECNRKFNQEYSIDLVISNIQILSNTTDNPLSLYIIDSISFIAYDLSIPSCLVGGDIEKKVGEEKERGQKERIEKENEFLVTLMREIKEREEKELLSG